MLYAHATNGCPVLIRNKSNTVHAKIEIKRQVKIVEAK